LERKAIIGVGDLSCNHPFSVALFPVGKKPCDGFWKYFQFESDAIAFAVKYADTIEPSNSYTQYRKWMYKE